jgi:alkanesulfonate monooxygenase SsuD/methylene tetrahydromethanopterin reductase-like flavin-dependent oxidoreductase (luciferase family)
VLGAAAQATSEIGLMTFVTCPTMRYHPAIVAQKAATMGLLSDGRFTLGQPRTAIQRAERADVAEPGLAMALTRPIMPPWPSLVIPGQGLLEINT